jgi:hypothetical protein
MAGRRQVWTGLTLLAMSAGLWAVAAGLVEPLGSLEAATLVATSMLISVCLVQLIAVPTLAGRVDPIASAAGTAPPALIWSCNPDTPGRPRPRAPGRGAAACAA